MTRKNDNKKKEIMKLLTVFLEVIKKEAYYTSAKIVWFYQKKYPYEFNNRKKAIFKRNLLRKYSGYMSLFSNLGYHKRITGNKSNRTYKTTKKLIEKLEALVIGKEFTNQEKQKLYHHSDMNTTKFFHDCKSGLKSDIKGDVIQHISFIDDGKHDPNFNEYWEVMPSE